MRWSASDRDHGNHLSVIILARRGNANWRSITVGPATGTATLTPKTLGRGKKLSLHLIISDLLNTTQVDARPIILTGP